MIFICIGGMVMLTCKICNFEGKQLHQHLRYTHGISVSQYKQVYGECEMQIVEPETIANRNISSVFTLKYWIDRGLNETDAKHKISEIQKQNNAKRKYTKNEFILCKEYWMTKHGYTESDAIDKISEIQASRSARSVKFSGKRHAAESKRKIGESVSNYIRKIGIDKHIANFGEQTSVGISKIEIECFNELKSILPELQSNIAIGTYVVDMITDMLIIEFNGTYWHADPRRYKAEDILKFPNGDVLAETIWEKDANRTEYLNQLGYQVFVIWETDWKHDKTAVINELKQIL
jgi:hypothetical protein